MKAFKKHYLKTACRKNIAFSARMQAFLQFFGIAIHNPFRDECCIDFECCNPYNDQRDKCWLHISRNNLLRHMQDE